MKKQIKKIWSNYSVFIIFVIILVFFSTVNKEIINFSSIYNVILNNTGIILASFGLSFVMIGGGIDFSLSFMISLMSVLISYLSIEKYSPIIIVVVVILVGLFCGLINGALVGYFNIVPFAVTIATQILFKGISYYISKGVMSANIADPIRNICRTYFLNVRVDIWLLLFGIFLHFFIIRFLYYGKHLRAIGLNEKACVLTGVNVKLIKTLSYCLAGVFYALSAMILTSRRGYAGPEIGVGLEITTIAILYFGGILSQAEKPNEIKIFIGALTICMIANFLPAYNMNSYIEYIFTGIILIVAMMISTNKK